MAEKGETNARQVEWQRKSRKSSEKAHYSRQTAHRSKVQGVLVVEVEAL